MPRPSTHTWIGRLTDTLADLLRALTHGPGPANAPEPIPVRARDRR